MEIGSSINMQDPWLGAAVRPFVMTKGEAARKALAALEAHYTKHIWYGNRKGSGGEAQIAPKVTVLDSGVLVHVSDVEYGQYDNTMLIGVYVSCRDGVSRHIVGTPSIMNRKLYTIAELFQTTQTFFNDAPDDVWQRIMGVDCNKTTFENRLGEMSFLTREHLPIEVAWSLRGLSIDEVRACVANPKYIVHENNFHSNKAFAYDGAARCFRVEYASIPVNASPVRFREFLNEYGRLPLYQDEVSSGRARSIVTPFMPEPVYVQTWHRLSGERHICISEHMTVIRQKNREGREDTLYTIPTPDLALFDKLPQSDRGEALSILCDSLYTKTRLSDTQDHDVMRKNGAYKLFEAYMRYGNPSIAALRVVSRVLNADTLYDVVAGLDPDNPNLIMCRYQPNGSVGRVKRWIPLNVPEKQFIGWLLSKGALPTKRDAETLLKNRDRAGEQDGHAR